MAFKEDFDEFLDEEQGFATQCIISPAFGRPYRIKGIFTNEFVEVGGGLVGISSSNPLFECPAKAVETVEHGDLLQIGETHYRIVGIRPNGSGWVRLELERQ